MAGLEKDYWDKKQSEVLMAIRFPLILLVLFIHVLPFSVATLPETFSANYLYIYISEFISHYLSSSVVPTFFVISGYYFFYRQDKWTFLSFINTLKKRVHTLLIPYILFNFLLLTLMVLKEYVMAYFHINGQVEPDLSVFAQHSFLDLMLMPVDFPLWYIRDLMLVCVFSPVFYFVFRYLRLYLSLLLCLLLYFGSLYTSIFSFLPITAVVFFGLGAFLALGRQNILSLLNRFRGLIIVVFLLLSLTNGFIRSYPFSFSHILFGVFAFISLMSYLIDFAPRLCKLFIKLSSASFFIYATHLIFIENWIKGAFSRTVLFLSGEGRLLAYFLTPFITLFICLGIFYIMKRLMPKLLAILCGGRI